MRRWLLVLVAVLLATSLGSRPGPADAAGRSRPDGASILDRWDASRAAAYAAGSAGTLRRLYVPRSRAGRRDVALLRAYAARRLRVTVRVQAFSVRVLEVGRGRLELAVVDRVGGWVSGPVDGRPGCLPIPAEAPAARVVTMRRVEGRWLVVAVRRGVR